MSEEIFKSRPTAALIGLGLIGGSMALAWKKHNIVQHCIGVDENPDHAKQALELNLVDEILPLEEAINKADIILLAVPVQVVAALLPIILAQVKNQIVLDVGSTKANISHIASLQENRGRFVATHPMWGTEHTGPAAATVYAFTDKAVVLCNTGSSDKDALLWTRAMYQTIGMHILEMESKAHDLHAAYVSHISHITSFALANTVLEKEREESTIFEMSSGGFESTVRLAKSNPSMWLPIFMQNRENVLDVLNEHITQLKKFKSCLEKENAEYLQELMVSANRIREII